MTDHFCGFYKAVVYNDADPSNSGRLQLKIRDLFGESPTTWAWPCVSPGTSALPAVGDGVWAAFEKGNPDYPIWVGLRSFNAAVVLNPVSNPASLTLNAFAVVST